MKISKRIVLSSIVCLLPLTVSARLYDQLPNRMPIHWNPIGEADGFIEKNIGAWGLPLLMLAIHLITAVKTERDTSRQHLSRMTNTLCFWSVPLVCVTLIPLSLCKAAGYRCNMTQIVMTVVGVLFIVAGNYLPKNQPNNIAGYKLPWTQKEPDNRLRILTIVAAIAALLAPVIYSRIEKN